MCSKRTMTHTHTHTHTQTHAYQLILIIVLECGFSIIMEMVMEFIDEQILSE